MATGHPIDVASGTVFTLSYDFRFPGTIESLWRRFYATDSPADSWLGRGWSVPYFMKLDVVPEGFRLLDESGSYLVFPVSSGKLEVGEKVISLGANMELQRDKGYFSILHWHHGNCEVERFVFDSSNEESMPLARIENLAGHRISVGYDTRSRPVRIVQELESRTFELTYGVRDLLSAVHFVPAKGPKKLLVSYEYDGNGRLIAAADALGHTTIYGYDSNHRIIRETNPLGSTFTFEYDARGRCIHASGNGGYMERWLQFRSAPHMSGVTDSQGNKTEYYLNPAGQVIQSVSPLGAAWTNEYDEYGRLITVTDPEGAVRSYRYDDRGDRVAIVFADGGESFFIYNDLHRLVEYSEPMGGKWTYEYDGRGNPLSLTNPLGRRLTCSRDRQGLVTQSRTPGGRVITRSYGPLFRWVEASDQISLMSRVEYDEYGNQTSSYDAEGLLQKVRFDARNRPVEVVDDNGRIARISYNAVGEITERTDPQFGWEKREYDHFGQIISHRNSLGAMRLEYDTEGRLTAVVNRAGERLERAFDAEGRRVEQRGFDGRIERYEYSSRGKPIKLIKSDGRVVHFKYDKAGALIGRETSDGLKKELVYNKNGDLIGAHNNDATLELLRNELGLVVAEIQNGKKIEYQLDLDSHRIGRRIEGFVGSELSLNVDVRGRLVSLVDARGVCQELRWDNLNRLIQRRLPGGVVEDLSYNKQGGLHERKVSSTQNGTIIRQRYGYDAMDCLLSSEDQRRGRSEYKHDSIGRLTEVLRKGRLVEYYRYNANGAILETHHGRRVVDDGGRTLAEGTRHYEYDADGCVARVESPDVGLQLRYNIDGQLVQVKTSADKEIIYAYDALGRRTSKQVDGVRTEFLWEGCVPAAECQDDTLTHGFYFHSLMPLAQWRGPQRLLPITDQRGAVLDVLSDQGSPLWTCTLDAYGNLVEEVGAPASAFRFRGQYHDRETGFHYNFHRTYAPKLGDYLSPDPIGLTGGSNFYCYPRNPLVWDDPFGLSCSPAHTAEERMDEHYESLGYRKISDLDKDLNANGIDGVYKWEPELAPEGHVGPPPPPPTYIIAEAKSGDARLGYSGPNGDVQQMSDHWINSPAGNAKQDRLDAAFPPGTSHADDIRTAAKGDVAKEVYNPDKTPSVVQGPNYGGPGSKGTPESKLF